MKPVIKRLLQEFWLPALLAALWTGYQSWSRWSEIGLDAKGAAAFIASTFGGSLFIFAWFSGQVVRVRTKLQVDGQLKGITSQLAGVADRLEISSENLIANITGGDSFCYLVVSPAALRLGEPMSLVLVMKGTTPMYDVTVELIDIDAAQVRWKSPSGSIDVPSDRHWFQIGNIAPNTSRRLVEFPRAGDLPRHGFTIVVYARNGSFSQRLAFYCDDAAWGLVTWAFKVRRFTAGNEVLLEQDYGRFPRKADGDYDWTAWADLESSPTTPASSEQRPDEPRA